MGITYGQTLQSYGSHWFWFSVSCNTLCSCCLCSINISRPTKTSCCNSCFSWVWRLSISSNLAYSKTNLTCKIVIFSRLALVLLTPSTWSGVASFNWVACVKLNTSAYNDMIRRRTCFSSSHNFAFSSFSEIDRLSPNPVRSLCILEIGSELWTRIYSEMRFHHCWMGSTTFRFTSLLNLMRYLSSVFLGWSTVGKASWGNFNQFHFVFIEEKHTLDLHPPCSERGMLVHSRLPLTKRIFA